MKTHAPTCVRAFAAIAMLSLRAAFAGDAELILSADQLRVLAGHGRPETLADTLQTVAAFGNRTPGEPGLATTLDWAETRLEQLGFELLGRQRLGVTVPRDLGCRLSCRLPDGATLEVPVFALWPNYVTTPFLPPEGLTAPLVYGGSGRRTDMDGRPVSAAGPDRSGAIVLMEFDSGGRWQNAASLGAGAVVFLPDHDATFVETMAKCAETPIQFPRFYLDDETAADRLREAARSGRLTARLTGGTAWEEIETSNLLALLPAGEPDADGAETLLVCIRPDASSLLPALAPGGQSAASLAAGFEALAALTDPALGLARRHHLLVLVDTARASAAAGLRAFAAVVRHGNALRTRQQDRADATTDQRHAFLARKMADIEPWMIRRRRVLDLQLGRLRSALDWLDTPAESAAAYAYTDPWPVTPSDLIPDPDAGRWLLTHLSDRVKQQQIVTLSRTADAERAAGANQFTPDERLPEHVQAWRRRRQYYRRLASSLDTPLSILAAMRREPLDPALCLPDDLTPRSLRDELAGRLAEVQTQSDRLRSDEAWLEKLAGMDITRAYVLDVSPSESLLTLWRGEVGGDRVAPSPQQFEWANALQPIVLRNLERISVLANHALLQAGGPAASPPGPVFDFVGRGDQHRRVNPPPHGEVNVDLSLAGVSCFTLGTGNDMRLSRLGPGNRIPNDTRSLHNLGVQSRTLALLLAHLLRDPSLTPHYEKNTPWCTDLNGIVVKMDERAGPFPKLPVPGTLVVVPADKPVQGACFTHRLALADSMGRFRLPAIPGSIYRQRIEAFGFSRATGMLAAAPDANMASRGGYETSFSSLDRDIFKRIVVFEGACVQLFDAIDPMLLQPLANPITTSLKLMEGKGGALASYYQFRPGEPGSALLALVPPDTRLKMLLTMSGFGARALLLGDQSQDPVGAGFPVDSGRSLHHTTLVAARDLWTLNDSRLRKLASRGIRSHVAERLHADATRDLPRMEQALASNRYVRAHQLARDIWGRELRAYPGIRGTINDALTAVVLLLGFLAPWALFMERVFLQAGSIRGRILGSLGFFGAAFAVLFALHPAFQISQTPIMILIAYTLATLAMLALTVMFGKYAKVMREWRERVGGVHQSDISRAGAFAVAFSLGLSNMAKRRLRTVLTIVMVALLAFSVMTFTSIEPYRDTRRIPLAHVDRVPFDGVLFRLYNWAPIGEQTAEHFIQDLGDDVAFVRRYGYLYQEPGVLVGPGGQGSRILLGRDTRRHTANCLLGFDPGEAQVSDLPSCVTGAWFSGADDEIILPTAAAARLGITAPDLAPSEPARQPRVMLGKEAMRVIGLLDDRRADRVVDLGGTPLAHVDAFLSGLSDLRNPEEDARALTLPVGDETGIHFIPFANTALVPCATVKAMQGNLQSLVVTFPPGTDTSARIDALMSRFAMNLYASINGRAFLVKTAKSQSVRGAWKLLLPLLLVSLIMVNLMLGTVDERQEEIRMLGAVGLAPRHVSILYLAEATALGVMGVVFGVLLGLTVSLLTRGMDVGVDVNYASVSTMLMGMLVLAIIVTSTLIPASRAARLATPSGAEKWNLPESRDGRTDLTLPFSMTRDNGLGVFAFLHEYLYSHRESTSADFRCESLTAGLDTGDGDARLSLSARLWLAPYDMRVSQNLALTLAGDDEGHIFRVHYAARQLTGELNAWNRANFTFIDLLRGQFLIYRTLSESAKAAYVARAGNLFNPTEDAA